jgi:S-(hydroxymethyl)glutathione dehydrogenase/alcohol dehydrogenase
MATAVPLHGLQNFANHTVLPEIALAKIRSDAPFDKVCYIGCGVTTGPGGGAVHREGGTGLARGGVRARRHRPHVIQGARMAGAAQIVGVDINPAREPMARKVRHDRLSSTYEVDGDLVAELCR